MKRVIQLLSAGGSLLLAWMLIGAVSQEPETTTLPTLSLSPDFGISNADFAALIDSMSEPEGYFDTDNFITNETSYLQVVHTLDENVLSGGVYLGVGPDQNFSYIVHTRPSLAIITDIRRQNMLEHLLLKVLIEEAQDRVDYLCLLLGRNCENVPRDGGFSELLASVRSAPLSPELLEASILRVRDVLLSDYAIRLTPTDLEQIEYVQRSFARAGLAMRFSSFGRLSSGYPTYEEILLERDRDGTYQNYLATEALFEQLQDFEEENRLIPVVGDFAGPDALRRVGEFLRDNSLEISVFYVSNVEYYLAGLPAWDDYLENLRHLPFRGDAVFIRAYFPTGWPQHPLNVPGHRSTSLVQEVGGFMNDALTRPDWNYWDVVTRHVR